MTSKEIEESIKLYREGKTLKEIGFIYHVSVMTVGRIFKKLGIAIRNKSEAAKGKYNHFWKGGRSYTKDGYVKIWVEGKRILEHRYIMEQMLGRHLKNNEIVHHINGIKDNNKPENLKLVTISSHMTEHIITSWSRKYNSCIQCGTIERKHAGFGLCTKCNQYKFEAGKRGYECTYINGKRIFSEEHRRKLSESAIKNTNALKK